MAGCQGACCYCGIDMSPSKMYLFTLRFGTVLLTCVSVFMMGFASDHHHHRPTYAAFIYFIGSNVLVFIYSVAALVAEAKSWYDYSTSCWFVPMVDVVVVVVLLTSFGAACQVIFAISSFALLVSIAIAMTLLSSIAYVLLFAFGVIAVHRSQSS